MVKNNKQRLSSIKALLGRNGRVEHEDSLWLIDRVVELEEKLLKANSRYDDAAAELMKTNLKILTQKRG